MATFGFVKQFVSRSCGYKKLFLAPSITYKRCIPSIFFHKSVVLHDVKGQEIKMPSLSPTMTEGTLLRWLKKEGDTISPGDVLCEIQTDKAVVGFEVEEEGILAKILVPDDTKDVKIGTVIGMMVEEGEDWKNVASPVLPDSTVVETQVEVSRSTGKGIEIKMPSLSPTMTEGTIIKWLKQEGENFSPGDVLCEIQTDKAVVGFETEEEGILAKILVPEGTKEVQLGTVIAIMVMEGEDWKNVDVSVAKPQVDTPSKPSAAKKMEAVSSSKTGKKTMLYGPAVRNLLEEYGIEYSLLKTTGPHNVLLKGDVLKFIKAKNLKRKPPTIAEKTVVTSAPPDITFMEEQEYIDIPNTNMRQTIAKRLTESKTTIPHAYISIDCVLDDILKLRKNMKNEGIKVSVNDFIIKCAALTLQTVPEVNVIWSNNQIQRMTSIDISVAVATDIGLITPIVKCANGLGVQQISECVKGLAAKAKEGTLKPDEFIGGSFTISNLGMFGISEFTAVINPPQGAILAIGTSRLIFGDNNKPVTKMIVTLSYDGRMIDEDVAGKFLQCFKQYLENPLKMIIGSPSQKLDLCS